MKPADQPHQGPISSLGNYQHDTALIILSFSVNENYHDTHKPSCKHSVTLAG